MRVVGVAVSGVRAAIDIRLVFVRRCGGGGRGIHAVMTTVVMVIVIEMTGVMVTGPESVVIAVGVARRVTFGRRRRRRHARVTGGG